MTITQTPKLNINSTTLPQELRASIAIRLYILSVSLSKNSLRISSCFLKGLNSNYSTIADEIISYEIYLIASVVIFTIYDELIVFNLSPLKVLLYLFQYFAVTKVIETRPSQHILLKWTIINIDKHKWHLNRYSCHVS